MLKYVDTKVVFQEVPDEITLAINISGCPCHCEGCHSAYLADDIGEPLTRDTLCYLINNNGLINCVCFLGGDSDPAAINELASDVKYYFPHTKVAWYSGRQELSNKIDLCYFDFIKLGPYNKDLGPLNSKTTNQRFYNVVHLSSGKSKMYDVTYKFQKKDD
jgi:anaerobic ribonucleoside-triphosphate reductase activating protein